MRHMEKRTAHWKFLADRRRNSSIELMRILAMLLITAHHALLDCGTSVTTLPLGVNKVLLETFAYSGGKIGVVLFFLISAWYLPVGGSIRASFRRVWLMEREVLFWSLALLMVNAVLRPQYVGVGLVVQSLLPMSTNLWWYITSYAVFLLLFPFLATGLKALGRRRHLVLCVVCFVMWSLGEGFAPVVALGLPGGSFLSFVYLYTLMSFYKWYMRTVRTSTAWAMVGVGYGMLLAGAVLGGVLYGVTGKLARLQVYLSGTEYRLCVLLVGFGVFALFVRREFHSAVVNNLAAGTLAVYLITEYPPVRTWLWQETFADTLLGDAWYAVPAIFGVTLAVMAVVFVLDSVRRVLFGVTVDRHRGRLFDRLWDRIIRSRLAKRLGAIGTDPDTARML